MLLDAGINGADFSPLNKVGIVICLTGVALHVFRKVKMGGLTDAGVQNKVQFFGTDSNGQGTKLVLSCQPKLQFRLSKIG